MSFVAESYFASTAHVRSQIDGWNMKLGSFNIKHDLEIFLRVRISSLSEKLFSDCLVHPFKIHFVTSVSDFVYYYCQWFWRFSSVLELQRVRFPLISKIFQRFNFPINFRKIRNMFFNLPWDMHAHQQQVFQHFLFP